MNTDDWLLRATRKLLEDHRDVVKAETGVTDDLYDEFVDLVLAYQESASFMEAAWDEYYVVGRELVGEGGHLVGTEAFKREGEAAGELAARVAAFSEAVGRLTEFLERSDLS